MGVVVPNPQKKYICKICGKSCDTGRSLGGHMRLHLPLSSLKHKNVVHSQEPSKNSTTREATDESGHPKARCKKCNKEFGSMRAMFGHMKCHSKKQRRTSHPDHGENSAIDGVFPEFKNLCHVRRKRSRIKYKIGANWEEEEEADVAECLIMLSRGPEYQSDPEDIKNFKDK